MTWAHGWLLAPGPASTSHTGATPLPGRVTIANHTGFKKILSDHTCPYHHKFHTGFSKLLFLGGCSKFSNAQTNKNLAVPDRPPLCGRTEQDLESCKSLGQTCRCQPLEWKIQAFFPEYQHMVSVRYTLENHTTFGR